MIWFQLNFQDFSYRICDLKPANIILQIALTIDLSIDKDKDKDKGKDKDKKRSLEARGLRSLALKKYFSCQ